MPTSWYHVIPRILSRVLIEKPDTILDVGIGFGKYGLLLREAMEVAAARYEKKEWQIKIDGVEAFEGYRNPIHDYIYDHVDYRPIEDVLPSLGCYDVILLVDVLEHFDKDTGFRILNGLLEHTNKALIVSTPIIPAKQEEYKGNTYEAHKSRWYITDFSGFDQDFALYDIGYDKALIVKLYPNEKLKNQNKSLRKKDTFFVQSVKQDMNSGVYQKPLNIAYVLPPKFVTGSMKTILNQISWLKSRGHKITAVLRSATGDTSALPDRNMPPIDKDIVLKPDERYDDAIKSCDIAVAGCAQQLPELSQTGIPIVYTEQGSEPLLGDLRVISNPAFYHQRINDVYSSPCYFCAVSEFIANILKKRFVRESVIVPSGVDTHVFYPGTPPNSNVILMTGSPALPFKGFDTALQALELAWLSGERFKVNWICPCAPEVAGNSFPINAIVNPPAENIPRLYREADIFLFSSWFEGFGMPPLEAMASGLPVVCTHCGGNGMYVKPLQNAVVVPPGDERAMAAAIQYLLANKKDIRTYLSLNARQTALDFSLDKSLIAFEAVLQKAATLQNRSAF